MAHAVKRWLAASVAGLSLIASGALAAPPQPAYVTGSPVTGAIAKASGPQSVTTGDLSGDVTTSGSTATTLAPSGVSAGTYGDATHVPQITLDAKGRATSATSVVITGGGTPGGSSGQIQYNNAGAFAGANVSGDCTATILAFVCTKTNGVSFAASATTDTTSASNISSGTLAAARGGAGTVNGILKANGSGTVSQATSGTDYAPATSGAALLYGNGSGGFSNASVGPGLSFAGGMLSNTGTGGSASWTANPFCSTAGGADPCLKYGAGAPTPSADPAGSVYMDTTNADLYLQIVPTTATMAVVQTQSSSGTNSAMTLPSTPTAGNLLIAECSGYLGIPGANTGWVDSGLTNSYGVNTPGYRLVTHQVVSGDTAAQTPCTGNTYEAAVIWEISGAPSWGQVYDSMVAAQNSTPTLSTPHNNNLVLGAVFTVGNGVIGVTTASLTGNPTAANSANSGIGAATGAFPTAGTNVTLTYTNTSGLGTQDNLLALKLPVQGWQKISRLARIQDGSGDLSTEPMVLKCGGNLTCSATASPYGVGDLININGLAAASAANPTATAGPTAINGSAATFMRSDAAPAVQQGSASQKGVVQVDGTTITAASGVISATGPTISGTPTTNNCVKWASATALGDAGAACGSGGGTTNNYYAGALTLIQTCTPAGITTCTFSNIPQGYADLVLAGSARSSTAGTATDVIKLTINGDTGNNYQTQVNYSNGSGTNGALQTGVVNYLQVTEAAETGTLANLSVPFEAVIPNYTNTTLTKGAVSHYLGASGTALTSIYNVSTAGTWNSTAAVTSLTMTLPSNFASGSQISLYGRGGSNVTVNPQPGLPVICEVVTSGSASSVTIGGGSGACPTLPSTYRDLQVVVAGRSQVAGTFEYVNLQFNGDTGANYSAVSFQPVNSSTSGTVYQTGVNGATIGWISGATSPANRPVTAIATVSNYAGTTFYKKTISQGDLMIADSANNKYVGLFTNWWNTASAITSLKIYPSATQGGSTVSGPFADGTVITVYGIGGSPTATLPVAPPQGRLTLTSNTPVMTADATAQTTIYYTPYVGTLLPVGNIMYRFSQLSYALNTTAHASGSLYDVFAYNSSGAITLCTGPAWTNSTTRSAAISMDAVNGIWENTASLTCNLSGGTTTTTIAAAQATYLGTFYATAAGQTGMAFTPAAASGGSNNILGLYNAYNRVTVSALERDSTSSWTYNSTTWRAANNSSSNRVSFVDGLQQSRIRGDYRVNSAPGGGNGGIAVLLDATTGTPQSAAQTNSNASMTVMDTFAPQLGFHYVQAAEVSDSGSTSNFYGAQTSPTRYFQALRVTLENGLFLVPAFRRRRRPANDDRRPKRAAA